MKKKLFFICLLFSVNLYASLVSDGLKQERAGNYEEAVELYKKACDSKIAIGCHRLANLYFNGISLKQNNKKAKELYAKSCKGGVAEGCHNLAVFY